jgi:ABC-type glycerol-3-phosphate transport system permease component
MEKTKIPANLHRKHHFDLFFAIVFIFLLLYVISLLLPVFWTLLTALKSPKEFDFDGNTLGWPTEASFSNFATAYKNFFVRVYNGGDPYYFYMGDLFANSLYYTVGCALAATITPCFVAYVVADYPYKFGKIIYAIVIVAMALPIIGALPSEIQVSKTLGIYDTFIGLWIMKANFLGIYFLVFYAQFKMIPKDYIEAAKVDGAGNFRIMFQVIMPFALGTMLTVFLLNFITYWNDYQIPMIYLPSHPVAAYGMYVFQMSTETALANTPVKLAGIFLMAAPIVLVALIFSRRLMANLSVGGVKE